MSSTTDPHGRPKTGLHGEGELDAKTDVGSGNAYADRDRHGIETGDFDREIDVRKIVLTGAVLAVAALVIHLMIWGLMRGMKTYDDRSETTLTPMQKIPQPPPPLPRLQVDPTKDMVDLRAQEDLLLNHAGWVDRQGGTLRVPVDVAIDAIAQRGVAPFQPMGGAGSAATSQGPLQTRAQQETPNPTDNRKPGATVQSAQGPAAKPAAPAAKPPGVKPPVR